MGCHVRSGLLGLLHREFDALRVGFEPYRCFCPSQGAGDGFGRSPAGKGAEGFDLGGGPGAACGHGGLRVWETFILRLMRLSNNPS